eukprot:gene13555-19426_t
MASTLASALQALSNSTGQQHAPAERKHGKSSLLFTQAAASEVDVASLYQIGTEELARVDPRFNAFGESLFGCSITSFQRENEPAAVLLKLNQTVDAFLHVLSDHFLSPACFKALEFLIRKFKIHENNVDALLACALPYHSTNEFVRLVQCLALSRSSGFNWLEPIQKSGAALPRDILVQRCINDQAVLKFICSTAQTYGSHRGGSFLQMLSGRTFLSFYAVTVCEMLSAVKEDLVATLLSNITSGLGPSASPDYRAATLMVVAELCTQSTLGLDLLNSVISSALQHMDGTAEQVQTILLVLAHMASTQPLLTHLPPAALKRFVALPSLVTELSSMKEAQVHLRPLMLLLTSSLVLLLLPPAGEAGAKDKEGATPDKGGAKDKKRAHSRASAAAEALLMEMAHAGVLTPVAQELATSLLRAAPSATEVTRPSVMKLLRALDLRYPAATDAAINSMLRSSATPAAAVDNDSDSDMDGDEGKEGEEQRTKDLFAFVREAFASSAHAPCGDMAMTLAAAVSAPQSGIRIMALKQMSELLQDKDIPAESQAYTRTCLLSALADQELDVANAVLSIPKVVISLPPAALLTALQTLLARTSSELLGPTKLADTKAAHKAAKRALHIVALAASATGADSTDPAAQELVDQATLLVLQYCLPTQHATRLCSASLAAAAEMAKVSPLMKALAGASDAYATFMSENEDPVPTESKETEAALDEDKTEKGKKGSKKKVDKKKADEAKDASEATPGGLATKQRKRQAAAALENSVIEALGSLVVSAPDETIASITRLLATARQEQGQDSGSGSTHLLRSRHVLLLSVLKSLHLGGPVSKKKVASSATSLHTSLMNMAMTEISAIVAAASTSESATASLFSSSWQTSWAEMMVDVEGCVPTYKHLEGMLSSLTSTHMCLLCAALLESLKRPTEGKEAAGQMPLPELRASFLSLAPLHPASAFTDHLRLLLSHGLPTGHAHNVGKLKQQLFLANLYADPSTAPAVASTALGLQVEALCLTSASKDVASSYLPVFLPHLLAALNSESSEVRKAAVSAVTCIAEHSTANASDVSSALAAVAQALAGHARLLESDAGAICWLLRNTFAGEGAADATPDDSSQKMTRAAAAAATASTTSLELGKDLTHELHTALVKFLPRLVGSPSAVSAATTVLSTLLLPDSCTAALPGGAAPLGPPVLEMFGLLVQALSKQCDSPQALQQLASADPTVASKLAPLRLTAFQCLVQVPDIMTAASAGDAKSELPLTMALIASSANDDSEECRAAAREVLTAISMSAAKVVVPVLQVASAALAAGGYDTHTKEEKPQKRKKSKASDGSVADGSKTLASGTAVSTVDLGPLLRDATLVLELMQWKKNIQGVEAVVESCQQLLSAMMHHVGSIAVVHGEEAPDDVDDSTAELILSVLETTALDAAAAHAEQAPPAGRVTRGQSSVVSPLMDLFKMELIVQVADQAPDSAVRNAALSLLAVLAGMLPDLAVEHVLKVMSLLNQTSAVQEDQHSRAVVATALAAVVPAWIQAGKDVAELWEPVVEALPGVPAHRRMILLSSEQKALPSVLRLLLLKSISLTKEMKAAAVPVSADEVPPSEWCPALAAELCSLAETSVRLRALGCLMEDSTDSTDSAEAAVAPLSKLAINFVAIQLKAKAGSPLLLGLQQHQDPAVQSGCEAIMTKALAVMQTLSQGAASAESAPRNVQKAVRSCTDALYSVFDALQSVMASDTYLQALASLAKQPDDKVKRRALKLFAAKVKKMPSELLGLAELLRSNKAKEERATQFANAAMLVCPLVTECCAPTTTAKSSPAAVSAVTRQSALMAAAAAATAFGAQQPAPVMACLPALLTCASTDPNSSVRGSALAALAAAVAAVGKQLLPMLPKTVGVVMETAQGALQHMAEAAAKKVAAAERVPQSAGKKAAKVKAAADPEPGSWFLRDSAGVLFPCASICDNLPTAVPARLLLEPLFGQLQFAVGAGISSVVALMKLVGSCATGMESKVAALHHESMFLFLLRASGTSH